METPFTYGKIETGEKFINRQVETTNLVWDFVSLSNTIIISPRGWGESSLVNKEGKISFQDPIYVYWLKTDYFAK